MERFCKDLREHAMKIINYEKKGMIPLTHEENELMQKKISADDNDDYDGDDNKITIKSEIIVITLENLEEPLIVFVT